MENERKKQRKKKGDNQIGCWRKKESWRQEDEMTLFFCFKEWNIFNGRKKGGKISCRTNNHPRLLIRNGGSGIEI